MPDVTSMPPGQPNAPQPDRVVNEQDKALARDWLKRIEAAQGRDDHKKDIKRYEENRKWLRGIDPENGKRLRTNLHFANLAAMRPQVYAKDPEYAVAPTKAVPEERLPLWQAFGETAETVLDHYLIKRGKLKKRAKRLLTSAYTNAVGWWKVCWQEDRRTDALIVNQIKDTQDNLDQLQLQRTQMDDAQAPGDNELKVAKLRETLAGLQSQSEVTVSRGPTVDFVMPEDVLVLDASVLEIADYERADALAHGLWMTREQYRKRFRYDPKKGKVYSEAKAGSGSTTGPAPDKRADLLRVWEIWDQASNRVHTVCEGEEGFCKPSFSPEWTGERWFPLFLLCFNEIDGAFMPLSDVDLTIEVVKEYNRTRDDFERDRRNSLPLNVVRKGGALTPGDVERITNRQGSDVVVVEGGSGRPLSEDIWSGQLAQIRPENYDTSQPRGDMEMLVGGGDAARGAVLKAKTATEAEILSQGLRGRSAERTDIIEDLLSDVGKYTLEMCLRMLSQEDVQKIAGPKAVWPELSADQVFQLVTLQVRGGSTGKPDRLQEQDRWTKLLPVIEKAMGQVSQLRQAGEQDTAQAVIELVRETLRRFDERIDIERFLPAPKDGEQGQDGIKVSPQMLQQAKELVQELQAKVQELTKEAGDKQADRDADIEKAKINALASIEQAEKTARIKAAADVEVARISAGAKMMTGGPPEPQGLVAGLDAVGAQDQREDAVEPQGDLPEIGPIDTSHMGYWQNGMQPMAPEFNAMGQQMPAEPPGLPESAEPPGGEYPQPPMG